MNLENKGLWSKEEEKKFFENTLKIATPDQLFYVTSDGRYLAYWPKKYRGKKTTLQSRNTFIGTYTEKWVKDLLEPLAKELDAHVIHGAICEEIGLSKRSPADVAISKKDGIYQDPENILLIIEVKMSIVWNWEYNPGNSILKCIGDYTTHQGNPGLLRSDSMLKAIGKSINIRVSGPKSSKIPIIIVGNTPITESYYRKVDLLKKAGVIQGFYSLNPKPTDAPNGSLIKSTPLRGYVRIDSPKEFFDIIKNLANEDSEFFSAMIPKHQLGRIIEISSKEKTYTRKAEKFLELIRSVEHEK